jgi:hypothetical protein
MFTRFSRYPAGKLISCGALWAIDELNSYNSIVYKNLPLKGTFCSLFLRERAGVRGKGISDKYNVLFSLDETMTIADVLHNLTFAL